MNRLRRSAAAAPTPGMLPPPPPPDLAEKVAALSVPQAYPERVGAVEVIETHMSFVFLTERHAYKLKKPVRYEFLDFSTLAARRRHCLEELRINRRLAAARCTWPRSRSCARRPGGFGSRPRAGLWTLW